MDDGAGQVDEPIFAGEGHFESDLKFRLRLREHPRFERRGDDLYTNLTISLQDALTGFETEIEHLDGHKVQVVRDKVTWPGARIRKKDEGMPSTTDSNDRGFLFITFDVEFPRGEISSEDKAAIRTLFRMAFIENESEFVGGQRLLAKLAGVAGSPITFYGLVTGLSVSLVQQVLDVVIKCHTIGKTVRPDFWIFWAFVKESIREGIKRLFTALGKVVKCLTWPCRSCYRKMTQGRTLTSRGASADLESL